MIRDRETAVALSEAAEKLIRELIRAAEHRPDEGVAAEEARRQLVQLVGSLESQLLGPLYKQYPDLDPVRRSKP
jgi:hypothetical protein